MSQSDSHIDELLNSFIDAELTPEQQKEVERLIADDEQVARRLRDLQRCKMLVQSLPREKAPDGTFEQITVSLEQGTLREASRPFVGRRILAVAAMIAVMAVLAVVIHSIGTPEGEPRGPAPAPAMPGVSAAAGFAGRLELRTNVPTEVGAFVSRAIADGGLSTQVDIRGTTDRKVYSLSAGKGDVNLLLQDLATIWDKFGSATLFVQTEAFGPHVTIDEITAQQIATIVNQDSREKCIKVASDLAILNHMAKLLPASEISRVMDEKKPSLLTVPKPFLTGGQEPSRKSAQPKPDEQQVRLTIVVQTGK
jgi:hypothetical protein